jgi:glyoxylase-like metal-dependent hydrolase (beta-lactamase superfamily II)
VFANAGAIVVGQRNVRGWIHTENLKFLGPNPKPEQKAFIDALRPPVVVYEQALDLYIGSREVRIRSFPGHTGGDSVVLIPDARVAFGGDLFWRNTAPNMIDASTTPWIATLESLSKSATSLSGHTAESSRRRAESAAGRRRVGESRHAQTRPAVRSIGVLRRSGAGEYRPHGR